MEENRKAAPNPDKHDKDDSILERAARKIAPPSNEVSDDDLKDPGRMTPGAPPTDNRS
jgi:hypothetical protein